MAAWDSLRRNPDGHVYAALWVTSGTLLAEIALEIARRMKPLLIKSLGAKWC
jgi:hypothetical protein